MHLDVLCLNQGPDHQPIGGAYDVYLSKMELVGPKGRVLVDTFSSQKAWPSSLPSPDAPSGASGSLRFRCEENATTLHSRAPEALPALQHHFDAFDEFTHIQFSWKVSTEYNESRIAPGSMMMPFAFNTTFQDAAVDRHVGTTGGELGACAIDSCEVPVPHMNINGVWFPNVTNASLSHFKGDSGGTVVIKTFMSMTSHWQRSFVLLEEGILVVVDAITPGYEHSKWLAGPTFLMQTPNATVQADRWWDTFGYTALNMTKANPSDMRLVVIMGDGPGRQFNATGPCDVQYGALGCRVDGPHLKRGGLSSQLFAHQPIKAGETVEFVTVFVPYKLSETSGKSIAEITEIQSEAGRAVVTVPVSAAGDAQVTVTSNGSWTVSRQHYKFDSSKRSKS